jgi:D-alanine--poly(phosphoribitol) ligase subunit 1
MAEQFIDFLERFEHIVEHFPDNIALKNANEHINYKDLNHSANKLALVLKGLVLDEWLGIRIHPSIDTYIAIIAIWKLGKAYIPLHPAYPIERYNAIATVAPISTVIFDEGCDNAQAITALLPNSQCFGVNQLIEQSNPSEVSLNALPKPDPCSLAYVLFTSGSTGQPKGVPIQRQQLNAFLSAILDFNLYDFNSEDIFLQTFELTFDLSVFSFAVPLSIGASCCLLPKEGQAYLNITYWLEEFDITVVLMVPSILGYLAPYFGEMSYPAVRYSLFCGEALPSPLVEQWESVVPNAQIENVYGPTEATIFCSRYIWDKASSMAESFQGIVPIGQPLPNMQFHLALVDEEVYSGELIIEGSQVGIGYLNNPVITASAFLVSANGFRSYKSGDRCSQNEQGNYLYISRMDHQVKIDGYRIELGEIEHQVLKMGGIAATAVVPFMSSNNRKALCCFIALSDATIEIEAIQSHLRTYLPAYMIPAHFRFLEQMPLNDNGKTNRKQLEQLASAIVIE